MDFSQPVSLEEAQRHFSVTSVTGIEIFQAGSQAQVLPEPKNPLRFYLRSPLMKPGDKEDLVLFSFRAGLKAHRRGRSHREESGNETHRLQQGFEFLRPVGRHACCGGHPLANPSRRFSSNSASRPRPRRSPSRWRPGNSRRSRRTNTSRIIPWTKENVTDEVLAKSEKLPLELITTPDAPPMEAAMALRVAQQPGGKVFVKVPKDTAGPGGFVTAEDFRDVTVLPAIPKEAALLGKGGLLALNGERKINVQSRGLDHLRYTVARVQTSQINHLVSQTSGSFESPRFRGGFGLENMSDYEQSVQPIVKKGEYGVNYSSFDFSPLLQAAQPGATPAHGLFHLTVEGVRPRTPEDGDAAEGSPDQDWVPMAPQPRPELRLRATILTAGTPPPAIPSEIGRRTNASSWSRILVSS